LNDRARDNWLALISIADAAGGEWPECARRVALELTKGVQSEEPNVLVLEAVRESFDTRRVTPLASADIIYDMLNMEGGMWLEWRGKNGNRPAGPITQAQLADVLHDFQIRPRTIRPVDAPDGKTKRGYHCQGFEQAWAAYCPSERSTRRANMVLVRGGRHG
jgi:putative DNA primase/helicase